MGFDRAVTLRLTAYDSTALRERMVQKPQFASRVLATFLSCSQDWLKNHGLVRNKLLQALPLEMLSSDMGIKVLKRLFAIDRLAAQHILGDAFQKDDVVRVQQIFNALTDEFLRKELLETANRLFTTPQVGVFLFHLNQDPEQKAKILREVIGLWVLENNLMAIRSFCQTSVPEDKKGQFQKMVLIEACRKNKEEIASYALKEGTQIEGHLAGCEEFCIDCNVVLAALNKGNVAILKLLLAKGAKLPDGIDNISQNVSLEMQKFLFQLGVVAPSTHLIDEDVQLLLSKEASTYYRNEEGKMAFEELCATKAIDRIYFFIERDPKLLTDEIAKIEGGGKRSLLYIACEKGNLPLVKELLARGASGDQKDGSQFTAFDWALALGQFECAKAIADHYKVSFDDVIEAKFLAHVWGLNGESDGAFKVSYEGFNRFLAAQKLAYWANAFLDNAQLMAQFPFLTEQDRQELKAIVQRAPENISKSPGELLASIQAGNREILFTGWKSHINVVMLAKEKLVKADRQNAMLNSGAHIYKHKSDKMAEAIKLLQDNPTTSCCSSVFFAQDLDALLELKKEAEIHQKQQPCGNCGWSGAKAIFLGLLAEQLSRQFSPSKARYKALLVYKSFNSFVKERADLLYVSRTKTQDANLLKRVAAKKLKALGEK